MSRCVECNGSHDVRSGLCTLCRGDLAYLAKTSAAQPPEPTAGQVECVKCGGGSAASEMTVGEMGHYCPACMAGIRRMYA
jgi:hypothetical protein